MSRRARGLMAALVLGMAVLAAAALALPIEWIVGFFAITTTLSMLALGVELWRASRELVIAESNTRR